MKECTSLHEALDFAMSESTRVDRPQGILRINGKLRVTTYEGLHKHKRGAPGRGKGKPAGNERSNHHQTVIALIYPDMWFGGRMSFQPTQHIYVRRPNATLLNRLFEPMPYLHPEQALKILEENFPK